MRKWQIASVEIKQFRGVADTLAVPLGPGLNVILGDNGAGKTTFCHAIEWALFGKIPSFSRGAEFQAEDAIANRLSSGGPSAVRLTLEGNGHRVRIMRTRTRGESSTRGPASARFELDDRASSGKDAEADISELVGFQPADLNAGIYLRQENVAELLLGDEELRSAAFDRLLGLGLFRDLLDNLQLAAFDRVTKQLNSDAAALQEGVIGAASMRRVQLARKREALVAVGWSEAQVSMKGVAERVEATQGELRALRDQCGASVALSERHHGTLSELRRTSDDLSQTTFTIERYLTDREVEVRSRIGRLDDLRDSYERASAADRELQAVNLDELRGLRQALTTQKAAAEEALGRLRVTLLAVRPVAEQIDRLSTEIRSLKERTSEDLIEELTRRQQQIEEETNTVSGLLEQQATLSRLVVAAKEHLTAFPSHECPVCAQPIASHDTLRRLEGLTTEGGRQSQLLADKGRQLRQERETVDVQLSALSRDRTALERAQQQQQALLAKIQSDGLEVSDVSPDTLRSSIEAIEEQYRLAMSSVSALEEQAGQLQARIAGVEGARAELEGVLTALKDTLGCEALPNDVAEAARQALSSENLRLEAIDSWRGALKEIREKLAEVGAVSAFLADVEEVEELEQKVPPVRRRLNQLQAAADRVAGLRAAVMDVYNALTAVQQNVLTGNMARLMPEVQELFSALGGHPEYSRLVVTPESDKKVGTNLYRIRAETEDRAGDTFVRTVFSRAELNVVALSLFVALSRATDSEFATIILDDPSQSLDPERITRLATVLQELSHRRQVVVTTEDPLFVKHLTSAGSANLVNLLHLPHAGTTLKVD